jgi:glycine/sarcosine/betaine reductase complex component A
MDLDEQASVKRVVDELGTDNMVVVLGSPTADSAELYAATVSLGDPTYAGPLAGLPLGLPVYHVLDPDIVQQLPKDFYEQNLAVPEMTLDTEDILATVDRIRAESAKAI